MSHETISGRILKAQGRLRRLDPENPLLNLVKIYDYHITQTPEFLRRYYGFEDELALSVYADEMERECRVISKNEIINHDYW